MTDDNLPRCCAEDALRADIADKNGNYAGAYHGGEHERVAAKVQLGAAEARHPDHALTTSAPKESQ